MFETIARALDQMHVFGFLHRDVKPGNIFFVDAGKDWFQRPKLGDFGLAVRGTIGPGNCGTPCYAAPEVYGPSGRSTRFSDVYSLGVTMWECLAGKPPIERPFPKIPRIPRTLAAIVAKCLSDLELDRYGDRGIDIADKGQRPALRLADDLQAFLEHRPTLRRPLNRLQSTGLWVRRQPWQAGTFASLTLGLISCGGFAWQLMRSQEGERTEHSRAEKLASEQLATVKVAHRVTEEKLRVSELAEVRRYAKELRQIQDYIKDGKSDAAIAMLENEQVYSGFWEWLYLRSECDSAIGEFDVRSAVQAIAIGPHNRLAVAVAGGKIHLGSWVSSLTWTDPIQEPEQRRLPSNLVHT